jgi:hypothetical protein
MTDPRPPSEVELKYALAIYGDSSAILARIINEVMRLRALCGEAKVYIPPCPAALGTDYRNREMIDALDKASKGEI